VLHLYHIWGNHPVIWCGVLSDTIFIRLVSCKFVCPSFLTLSNTGQVSRRLCDLNWNSYIVILNTYLFLVSNLPLYFRVSQHLRSFYSSWSFCYNYLCLFDVLILYWLISTAYYDQTRSQFHCSIPIPPETLIQIPIILSSTPIPNMQFQHRYRGKEF